MQFAQWGIHCNLGPTKTNREWPKDGSPGLVFMGGDSRSKGREFESWHCIHFYTCICCTNCNVCFKGRIKTKKRPGLAHLKKEGIAKVRFVE